MCRVCRLANMGDRMLARLARYQTVHRNGRTFEGVVNVHIPRVLEGCGGTHYVTERSGDEWFVDNLWSIMLSLHHVLEGGWDKLPDQPVYHRKSVVFCFQQLVSLLSGRHVHPNFRQLRVAERAMRNASLPVRDVLMRRHVIDQLEVAIGLPRVLGDIVSQYLSPVETVGYGFPCQLSREPHTGIRVIVDTIDGYLHQYRHECRLRNL